MPTFGSPELNLCNLTKENYIVFAIGLIPKDCMNGNTWIEMDLSMAQLLNKRKTNQKNCYFIRQSAFVGLQTYTTYTDTPDYSLSP